MDYKDIFLTPLYLFFIYLIAYLLRNKICGHDKAGIIRKYFIPALTVKIIGAIALGLIYQFYYGGGDTFTYFRGGSTIWEAFTDSPLIAFKLILSSGGDYDPDTFTYARRIYYYVDPASYSIVRLSGFFSLFSFNTYTVNAIFFAVLGFTGIWALFLVFYDLYPHLHKQFAIAIFFIPSVFFWGSGILKDPVTLAAMFWAMYGIYFGLLKRKRIAFNIAIILISLLIIKTIKVYILLCFFPSAIVWIVFSFRNRIRYKIIRVLITPVLIALIIPLSYFAAYEASKDSAKYSLENITNTVEVTADYLEYIGKKEGGSVYSLGKFDGTPAGMLKKFPAAVWVTLFRPYLWEANNPVMLLSAMENTFFFALSVLIFFKPGIIRIFNIFKAEPVLMFCLIFSLTFAFSVGIATYNFGTLVRYKIPIIPIYVSMLYIIKHYSNKPKKLTVLEAAE